MKCSDYTLPSHISSDMAFARFMPLLTNSLLHNKDDAAHHGKKLAEISKQANECILHGWPIIIQCDVVMAILKKFHSPGILQKVP